MRWNLRHLFVLVGVFFLNFLANPVGDSRASSPATKAFKCHLEVTKVLKATIGRGPPYMVQILQNDPQHADLITAESHGDHHLSCTYQILMNSKTYRYRVEFPNTLRKLQETDCGTRE